MTFKSIKAPSNVVSRWSATSTMHCMTVSLAQGGAGLGTMWGEELAVGMLGNAGFDAVDVHRLEHDFQNNFYVMRKAQLTLN